MATALMVFRIDGLTKEEAIDLLPALEVNAAEMVVGFDSQAKPARDAGLTQARATCGVSVVPELTVSRRLLRERALEAKRAGLEVQGLSVAAVLEVLNALEALEVTRDGR